MFAVCMQCPPDRTTNPAPHHSSGKPPPRGKKRKTNVFFFMPSKNTHIPLAVASPRAPTPTPSVLNPIHLKACQASSYFPFSCTPILAQFSSVPTPRPLTHVLRMSPFIECSDTCSFMSFDMPTGKIFYRKSWTWPSNYLAFGEEVLFNSLTLCRGTMARGRVGKREI